MGARLGGRIGRFARARGGVAAIEFAVSAAGLILIVLGLLQLGYLAVCSATLQNGVAMAARAAALQASAMLASGTGTCAAVDGAILSTYTATVTPLLSAAAPALSHTWHNAAGTGDVPGSVLVVTAAYTWNPLLSWGGFFTLPLSATVAMPVIGSSDAAYGASHFSCG